MAEKEDVLTKTYDLLLYLIPQLEKFPRAQKFLLADRIELKVLDILERLLEAYYSPPDAKMVPLKKANIEIEQFRYLVRLSHDLGFLSHQKYGILSEKINEVGRMVGGWIKSLK
ncbi:MAG: diversity-generating retroelement protein Avd [bacterium]